MKPELIERLNQINREFYSTFAESFSQTRPASAGELEKILPYIADSARVLDVGCGNGRAAALLAQHRRKVTYVGVDASAEQMSNFKLEISKGLDATFLVADIHQPDWIGSLPVESFDCVLMLAVLHHIPGYDARARILRQVSELLAPQGLSFVSTWQFMDNERMRKKIVPWSAVEIDEQELEPGDALLNWKRGGTSLRYCHWIGEDELRSLAAQAHLKITDTFRAGGREGNLSLYAVLSA